MANKLSGIYKIQSIKFPERTYIGSAINLKRRKKEHFLRLKRKEHPNTILQRHYDKYGKHDLQYSIIESVPNKDDLIKIEQHYIDLLNPHFNICKVAGSTLGRPQSTETRTKRSKSSMGRVMSEETKKLMTEAANERYGALQDYENKFKVIELIIHDGDKRRVIAECPICQSHKEYYLQALRKRKANCGCIKCTRTQSPLIASKYKVKKVKANKYNGVFYEKSKRKWKSRVYHNGKDIYVGRYNCPTAGIIARDQYIINNNLPHAIQFVTQHI